MNGALEKAKGALDQIREMDDGHYDGSNITHVDLLSLARTQAEIAQAEALTDIAKSLRILSERQFQPMDDKYKYPHERKL